MAWRAAVAGGLAVVAILASSCGAKCMPGPTYIQKETATVGVSQPIDLRFTLRPTPESSTFSPTWAEPDSKCPSTVRGVVDGSDVHITGSIEQTGLVTCVVLLEEQRFSTCGAWARYDVTFDVVAP